MNPNVFSPANTQGSLPSARRDFIVATYKYLGMAIIAFIVLSAVLMMSGFSQSAALWLASSGSGMWLGVLAAFMVVGWLATRMADNVADPQKQWLGLGLYVVAEALIMSPMLGIAQMIAPDAIGAAAFVTAVLVGALTWTAFTSKSDFSFLGGILKVGGLVALGTIVAGLIFGFSLGIWFSGIMVVFAGGCVLYDTARVARDYPVDRPVAAALSLFASIALMFWYVLRILISLASSND